MRVEVEDPRQQARAIKRRWQQRVNERCGLDKAPTIRKLLYTVIGVTVLAIGILMIVTPGPAFLVIPLGLAILASEYAWARRIIRRGSVFVERAKRKHWRRSE
jgi:tellurite resistance protein TerC/cation:H+ antiporter